MHRSIRPSLEYNLIQELRLAQALMESRFPVSVPSRHAAKFQKLQEQFDVKFPIEDGDLNFDSFEIDHKTPLTSVGRISRPLIFPHAIVDRCRTLWRPERDIPISFTGLLTPKRETVVLNFCKRQGWPAPPKMRRANSLTGRLVNRARSLLGLDPSSQSLRLGELVLWSSNRGRTYPIKAWDEGYFELLGRSKFVLCPSGDFTWSYRFFESILCGAIPVVEEPCPVYEGFVYFHVEDQFDGLQWTQETALQNYELGVRRITIPTGELNSEIARLVGLMSA